MAKFNFHTVVYFTALYCRRRFFRSFDVFVLNSGACQ